MTARSWLRLALGLLALAASAGCAGGAWQVEFAPTQRHYVAGRDVTFDLTMTNTSGRTRNARADLAGSVLVWDGREFARTVVGPEAPFPCRPGNRFRTTVHAAEYAIPTEARSVGRHVVRLRIGADASGSIPVVCRPMQAPKRVFGPPKTVGRIQYRDVDESSGLVASRSRPDILWTHNDGEGTAELFAVYATGAPAGRVRLAGVTVTDFEDIAAFTCEDRNYLVCADTGNNLLKRQVLSLYVLPEPEPMNATIETPSIRIDFRFIDMPRDCEAVAVDPVDGIVLLASKDTFRDECRVYALPLRLAPTQKPLQVRPITDLPLGCVTAMDVSPDGLRVAVLARQTVYEYSRLPGESWPAAFRRTPAAVTLFEPGQSEALCYGADGETIYVTNEGRSPRLFTVGTLR